ncbi:hypothetical protein RD792_016793 [Penstemon davidsonii]|uniref:Uncharacterized protein n=1 Tax=Penstemon davidsonii TaxID=160366 RepID=A0ABR0CM78_9LAMI|nr:hypothetical protein RD792_016793 [Penstemon davidsonii]
MYKSTWFWVWDALWKRGKAPNFLSEIYEAGAKLPEYDFATIAAATNQFSHSNKIGRGGYNPVYKLWNEAKMLHLVDEFIEGAFSEEEALRCIQVGLLCTQQNRHHQPTISSVLKMLLSEELHLETQEKVVKAAAADKVNFSYISASNSASDNSESPPLAIETSQKDDHNVMTNSFSGSAATFEKDNTLSPLLNPLIESAATFESNHTPDPLTNPSIDNDDINTPKYVQ